MIHRRKGRKLKRTASHRQALLSNMAVSLIKNKKITTTLAKAKELRGYIESLITKARKAQTSDGNPPEYGVHLRREVNSYLCDREAVQTLFNEIAPKLADRNGGYTRVLKMGRRLGDSAEIALLELVDYNLEQTEQKTKEKASETETKSDSKKSTKTPKRKKAAGEKKASAPKKKKKAETT
jgi:large subunit ribosomal protein L17